MNEFNPKNYWEDRLIKSFNLRGVGFIGLGYNYNKWLYKVREHVFLSKLKSTRFNFNNASVLDVGCGNGFYIEKWKKVGVNKIVGIDITNVSVNKLNQKFTGDKFFQIDIGSNCIGILNNYKFDAISAFDVLFHIADDKRYVKAINNIFSLLKPNGFFLWSDNFLHKKIFRTTHHVSRSLEYIEMVLDSAGFKIVERRPMFYFMNAPIDTSNRFYHLLWKIITKMVSESEYHGWIVGSFLYPLELICVDLAKEGPSTEIMICKKI
jgi:SAM-dependent methyltransferase